MGRPAGKHAVVALALVVAGCGGAADHLSACRYEAERLTAAMPSCFGPAAGSPPNCAESARPRLVRACMQARGYDLNLELALEYRPDDWPDNPYLWRATGPVHDALRSLTSRQ